MSKFLLKAMAASLLMLIAISPQMRADNAFVTSLPNDGYFYIVARWDNNSLTIKSVDGVDYLYKFGNTNTNSFSEPQSITDLDPSQIFHIVKVGDDAYTIQNMATKKYVGAYNTDGTEGTTKAFTVSSTEAYTNYIFQWEKSPNTNDSGSNSQWFAIFDSETYENEWSGRWAKKDVWSDYTDGGGHGFKFYEITDLYNTLLKAHYTPLDYIEANGISYGNSFKTSYIPNENTEVEVKYQYYSSDDGYRCVFSGRTSPDNGISLYVHNNGVGYYVGGYREDDQFTDFNSNTDYVITANLSSINVSDGTTESATTNRTTFTSSTQPLELFANSGQDGNKWNNVLIGRIYYLKIIENSKTRYNLVPVMRHDGVYGYLDEASSTFIIPQTGSYTGYGVGCTEHVFYFTGLSDNSINLNIGKSQTITPAYVGTAPTFNYSTTDASIATVDANGKITAVGQGTATITVTADPNDGYGEWALTCEVTVVDETLTTYTALDYIEANGISYNNPFQTSYIANENTEIETKFRVSSTDGNWRCVFSGRTGGGNGMSMFMNNTNIGYFVGGRTKDDALTGIEANKDYTVTANFSSISISGGSSYTTTGTSTFVKSSQPIELFSNTGQSGAWYNDVMKGRIYYLMISESGTEKYDFEPVMRHDGVYGFYDANSNTFIQPKTGSYTGYSPGYVDGNFYLLGTDINVKAGKTASAITKVDGATYTYSIADESIATIDDDGVVTGVSGGTTTLTIIATYGTETWKASPTITVVPLLTSHIASFPLKTWKQGGTYQCEYLEIARENTSLRQPDADNSDWANIDYPVYSDTWKSGCGPFVNSDYASVNYNGQGTIITSSSNNCIFMRRMFSLTADELAKIKNSTVMVAINYDQFPDLLLNGNKIISATGDGNPGYISSGTYIYLALTDAQKEFLVEGNNVLAAMICEGGGAQFLDCGLFFADDYSIDEDGVIASTNNAVVTNDRLSSYVSTNLSNCTAIDLSGALELATTAYTSSQNVTADGIATMLSGTNVLTTVPTNSGITGTNIVNGGTISDLVLTDKVNFEPGQNFDATAQTATYTRTMNSGTNWGTIILPFTVSVTDDADIAFYTVESKTADDALNVVKTNTLLIGTPALFKTNSESFTLTTTNATVMSDIDQSTKGGLTLIGTYKRDTVDVDNTYYIKDNKFYSKGNYSFIVSPFRAYLQDPSGKSNGFSIVVDDDPTGINGAATGEAGNEIEGVYSVSGVKQSTLQKGINIIKYRNGKTQKVILK